MVEALLYLIKLSLQIIPQMNHILKSKLLYCVIWFVFQTKCRISNISTFQDSIPSYSGIFFVFWSYFDSNFKTKCKLCIQHIVLDNACSINQNIGRTPSFATTSLLKMRSCQAPLFENMVGGLTPPQQKEAQTMVNMGNLNVSYVILHLYQFHH